MIGDKLKETRIAAGLSQAKLCRITGMNSNMYSRYETGKIDPYSATVRRLCLGLNVSADYLLELSPVRDRMSPHDFRLPQDFPKERIEELQHYADYLTNFAGMTGDQIRLLRAFDKLDKCQQEKFFELMESISDK